MEDYSVQSVQSENIQSADLIKYSYSKREVSFAFISLILGFCFIKLIIAPAFIYELKIGLGASITMLFAIFFYHFFSPEHKKITGQKALRILLSIAFTVNIFISSNTLIQQLDMIFVMLILAYDKLSDTDEKYDHIRKLFPADLFSSVLILPFNSYGACRSAVKASVDKSSAGKI